jgi:hypothetical protein
MIQMGDLTSLLPFIVLKTVAHTAPASGGDKNVSLNLFRNCRPLRHKKLRVVC